MSSTTGGLGSFGTLTLAFHGIGRDAVTSKMPDQKWNFTLEAPMRVSVALSSSEADVDLRLFHGKTPRVVSATPGKVDESFVRTLRAGTYTLIVSKHPDSADGNYLLHVETSGVAAPTRIERNRMLARIMTHYLIILVVALVFNCRSISFGHSSTQSSRETATLSFQLILSRSTLLPYEPIIGKAVISNPKSHRQVRALTHSTYFLQVQFRECGDKKWTQMKSWWLAAASIMPSKTIIKPGASHTYHFAMYTFDSDGRPLFASGKKYDVRVIIPLPDEKIRLSSNTWRVSCIAPSSLDASALSAIVPEAGSDLSDSLLMALLPQTGSSNAPSRELKRIDDYVNGFSKSTYSLYCRRTYVIYVRATPGIEKRYVDKAAAYSAYLRRVALWMR